MRPPILPLIARIRSRLLNPRFPDPRTQPQPWRLNRKKLRAVAGFIEHASKSPASRAMPAHS